MSQLDELEEKKEELLESLEHINLDNRHERYILHKMIHQLEEGLHRFEEEELEEQPSNRNQG